MASLQYEHHHINHQAGHIPTRISDVLGTFRLYALLYQFNDQVRIWSGSSNKGLCVVLLLVQCSMLYAMALFGELLPEYFAVNVIDDIQPLICRKRIVFKQRKAWRIKLTNKSLYMMSADCCPEKSASVGWAKHSFLLSKKEMIYLRAMTWRVDKGDGNRCSSEQKKSDSILNHPSERASTLLALEKMDRQKTKARIDTPVVFRKRRKIVFFDLKIHTKHRLRKPMKCPCWRRHWTKMNEIRTHDYRSKKSNMKRRMTYWIWTIASSSIPRWLSNLCANQRT